MEIFCRDTKLNLSAYYLKPGFAFGGSCLPKDLKALLHRARSLDVSLPILSAVLPSNELQVERAVQTVIEHGSRKVGILGLSFKAGSDDLRNSPVVELAERLLGKGFELRIFDANVSLASIHGTNREYIMHRIPHISALLTSSIEEVLEHAGTLVIGNAAPEFRAILPRVGFRQTVVDLVRIGECHSVAGVYEGVCW
jgi:GDP-mannose 6-dehydrogenase